MGDAICDGAALEWEHAKLDLDKTKGATVEEFNDMEMKRAELNCNKVTQGGITFCLFHVGRLGDSSFGKNLKNPCSAIVSHPSILKHFRNLFFSMKPEKHNFSTHMRFRHARKFPTVLMVQQHREVSLSLGSHIRIHRPFFGMAVFYSNS